MGAAIEVRTDYTSADLRRYARRCVDADQVRRLLAIALILDGSCRSDAAKVAGVTLQIVRDWVLRFNAGGPEGLATRKAPGRASILNDEQRARLAEVVEAPARSRPRMASCAGGLPIWPSGYGTSSDCRSRATPLGASFVRWAIASSRPGRATRARGQKTSTFLKRLRRPSGAHHPAAPKRNACRTILSYS